jgi:hypothetical protein
MVVRIYLEMKLHLASIRSPNGKSKDIASILVENNMNVMNGSIKMGTLLKHEMKRFS